MRIPLAVTLTLVGCGHCAPPAEAPATVAPTTKSIDPAPTIYPERGKKLFSEGGILVDVRTQREWDEKHLEGANLIPIAEIDQRLQEIEALTNGNKNKAIVLYCRTGRRAERAKATLESAGYTNITNAGGLTDWPGN